MLFTITKCNGKQRNKWRTVNVLTNQRSGLATPWSHPQWSSKISRFLRPVIPLICPPGYARICPITRQRAFRPQASWGPRRPQEALRRPQEPGGPRRPRASHTPSPAHTASNGSLLNLLCPRGGRWFEGCGFNGAVFKLRAWMCTLAFHGGSAQEGHQPGARLRGEGGEGAGATFTS